MEFTCIICGKKITIDLIVDEDDDLVVKPSNLQICELCKKKLKKEAEDSSKPVKPIG
ncbi:hypothetical protein [Carboxydothermus hydrogenoformans]|uniref:Uncharacterized protein n=1 Tax=Carboxydothermus hydrogenoformans (strain ATCC BAA-161 / DSM 6008 / Z-2901) TaxID=246194 RepID=Q3ACF3_CARHZ|nr:hypothetical protein [Carboxydothermus hydrogenoformans]ABB13644.1 hypothetical protein CHY_1348 [Carboxydothermus hydrogenoformans Z-2901]